MNVYMYDACYDNMIYIYDHESTAWRIRVALLALLGVMIHFKGRGCL